MGACQNRCDLSGLIAPTAQHSVDELRRDAGSLIGAGHLKNLSGGRIEFSNSLSSAEVETLAADSMLQVLQTASPVAPRTWDLLNDQLFARRPDVELRVYGFCGTVCDLAFLPRLTNMRRFRADSLRQARGIEQVAALDQLESLGVGIYELESFDFLEQLPTSTLRRLYLAATKSKKPSLAPLARFDHLRTLYLEGQQKEIDVISHLSQLEDLALRSITVRDFALVRGLSRLWSLDIKLGGTRNLSALAEMSGLKYLELWQVRGLDDISVVSTLTGLQFLFLQSLPQIRSIPDLSRLSSLRRIYLENLNGLEDIARVVSAPALEEFMHASAEGMELDHYFELLKKPTLRRMWVGFGSVRKNEALRQLAEQAGIEEYQRSDFTFR